MLFLSGLFPSFDCRCPKRGFVAGSFEISNLDSLERLLLNRFISRSRLDRDSRVQLIGQLSCEMPYRNLSKVWVNRLWNVLQYSTEEFVPMTVPFVILKVRLRKDQS